MKTKTAAFGLLIVGILLLASYQYGLAAPGDSLPYAKIGIVSVRKVFRDCKVNATYRSKVLSEQSRTKAVEDKLQSEIQAQEAGLKALKLGSEDHLTQVSELFHKKASFEAERQFNAQKRALRDQRWTESLYQEFLVIVKELAKKKGLTLALEVDEPEFPVESTDELMMSLQTHKVIYSNGCVDLTAETTAELDKRESKFKF